MMNNELTRLILLSSFVNMLNISVTTLRNWEQGRRGSEGPVRVLLNIAKSNPEVLMAL